MSVLRFLVTRQALAALTRPRTLNIIQNPAQIAYASTLCNQNSNHNAKDLTKSSANLSLMQTRGHKRFGHQEEKTPSVTKYFHMFILSLFLISVMDWGKVKRMLTPKVDADAGQRPSSAAGVNGEDKSSESESEDSEDEEAGSDLHLHEGKKIREKVGFRERKV